MCRINLNQELNGIELSFECKPERATLDAIKAHGFRWNGKKSVWYAKQTDDRLMFAKSLGEIETAAEKTDNEAINLDNLGENCPASFWSDGGLSGAIRAELKRRGVKGCTVRQRSSGYTPSITVTVKVTADDMASIEEAALRFTNYEFVDALGRNRQYFGNKSIDYSEYMRMTEEEQEKTRKEYMVYQMKRIDSYSGKYSWSNKKHYFEFSTKLYNKLTAIWSIANQWNHDNSDSMSDYFDVGYYLDIDIKKPDDFEPRETMTQEERTTYEEEKRQEEEERARQIREEEERQAEYARLAEERERANKAAEELIYNSIIIEDLDESEQLYITDCAGGIGKECNLAELIENTGKYYHDCVIDRKVIFQNEDAYNAFSDRFLYDFIFISGKGGTGSEDVRLSEVKHIYSMTQEQRDTIKWYNCHCVGIYYDGCLKMIIDPQGYDYARYVYLPTETSEEYNAAEELKKQEDDSRLKEPFHFPDKIENQVANLHEGQEITIYQTDGWLLNSIFLQG